MRRHRKLGERDPGGLAVHEGRGQREVGDAEAARHPVLARAGAVENAQELRDLPATDRGGYATNPVGYIEGIFVKPDYRRRGVGRALVAAAEEWAASRGCTEMALDCLFDNSASELFHRKLGYCITERLIHLRRSLVR
jgi:GNAT superfamily N-acetyltransferase